MKKIVSVVLMSIMVLSLCGCGDTYKKYGEFYSLQEAYEQGYISKEDLMSIAYYYHEGMTDEEGNIMDGRAYNEEIMTKDYVPLPKKFDALSEETMQKMKETMAYDARHRTPYPIKKAKVEQVMVGDYYGTYNEYVAVAISSNFSPGGIYPDVMCIGTLDIGSVKFYYCYSYGGSFALQIWKEKV